MHRQHETRWKGGLAPTWELEEDTYDPRQRSDTGLLLLCRWIKVNPLGQRKIQAWMAHGSTARSHKRKQEIFVETGYSPLEASC